MPLRFRRILKIAPGLRINFNKGMPSLTIGPRGAAVNIGKKGITGTLGAPGSGFSYRQSLLSFNAKNTNQAAATDTPEDITNYHNYINSLTCLHTQCSEPIDWQAINDSPPPQKPERKTMHANVARQKLEAYKPIKVDIMSQKG